MKLLISIMISTCSAVYRNRRNNPHVQRPFPDSLHPAHWIRMNTFRPQRIELQEYAEFFA